MSAPSTYTTFYLVRHAQSTANESGIRAGQQDVALSKEGMRKALQLASSFKHIHFDHIFSSDLLRAKKTAEILGLEHTLAVKTTQLLRERRWGNELEGKTREETKKILAQFHSLSYKDRFRHKVVPDMESDEEIIGRFLTFLRETALSYPGKTILVVSHGNLMRTFLAHIGFATHQQLSGALEPLGYIKLRSDGIDFQIEETRGVELKP